MPYEKGGRADKKGNKYEINCIVYELLKVLDGSNYSVVIEALGEDEKGTDILVTNHEGKKEHQQCKARNGSSDNWTISDLKARKIFNAWKIQLDRECDRKVALVSPMTCSFLVDLNDRANNTSGKADEFYDFQIMNSSKEFQSFYENFCKEMNIEIGRESGILKSIDYLKRIYYKQISEYEIQELITQNIQYQFSSPKDMVYDTERFAQVRERIENMYSFTYLQKVTPKWNQELTENLMADTGLKRQEDFYRNYLKAYEGKNRVIVIISDAFRYECAKELMERLELDEKCTPKLECMISGLPSVTSVGMASLLPHEEMLVDGNVNVTVDGQKCGDLLSRDKILKLQNENNVALAFDDLINANQDRLRELLQGKNIVYIYHNQIDARGDKLASENEVFKACEEAIEEIHRLIHRLTVYLSAPKFFITADHGFLYKRDKLQEYNKVSYDREICTCENKRFLITSQRIGDPGMRSRAMSYLKNSYVTTPIGADIFKVSGGGQNYVHGGSSLQEMLIPVIELTTNAKYVAYDYVDVVLTTVNRKVTNLITYFDFIQTEKVTDTMKARSLVAYFTTEDGEKISFDVPIVANSREDAPEKRTFHEKFTLKSREYKYGDKYYLVLADANDEKNILQQYEFMIDIAFVDDFGF